MSQKPGRVVTAVNAGVAVALVALLAAVALVVRPPAPPGIAEFAPRAARPITKAPSQQGSAFGHGSRACTSGQVCVVPTPSRNPSGSQLDVPGRELVPSELQCYTWPDGSVTQTFDPQSPPCIASWPDQARGNGGATTKGVSGTEIRIAVPRDRSDPKGRIPATFERFFNNHFQFYGRQLRLISFEANPDTPSAQRASAEAAAALVPFAALGIGGNASDTTSYEDALIGSGVLTLRYETTETVQRQRSALFWSVNPQMDVVQRNLGAFLCGSLSPNQPARWAGGAEASKPRKYAILSSKYSDGAASVDVSPLVAGLTACGGRPEVVQAPYPYDQTTYQPIVLQLQRKGVTSVVAFDGRGQIIQPMRAASQVGYQPEWIEPGTTHYSSSSEIANTPPNGAPAEQARHLLGLTPLSKPQRTPDLPATRAYQEVQPAENPRDLVGSLYEGVYAQLLLLASGIQAAGPHVTHESFASALGALSFPNPGAGRPPSFQASVGFDDAHAMVRDFAVWSWDSSRRDPGATAAQPPGTRCYAERGKRWRLGTWPTTPIPLFQLGAPC